MQKSLYLLCPTDCLETVINNTFLQENYFYTSLGNSFNANSETVNKLKCMIQKYHIEKIYFVLACDNKIFKDALTTQDFFGISGLQDFYTEILKQREQSKVFWQNDNKRLPVLSYYLNKKIKNLKQTLDVVYNHSITISGKIYDRNKDSFTTIYTNLICLEKHHLN